LPPAIASAEADTKVLIEAAKTMDPANTTLTQWLTDGNGCACYPKRWEGVLCSSDNSSVTVV
jgi:hypothetical protein